MAAPKGWEAVAAVPAVAGPIEWTLALRGLVVLRVRVGALTSPGVVVSAG